MRINVNEKKIRKCIRQYHPNKYHMLIVTDQDEPVDTEIKIFPISNP